MIRATITIPVASSRLIVAPWSEDRQYKIIKREEHEVSYNLFLFHSVFLSLASFTTHQRLLVLHEPDNLYRLFIQLILKVIRQRRQHGIKVLLRHGVVHREDGLVSQKTHELKFSADVELTVYQLQR